jgi:hypothetical protein
MAPVVEADNIDDKHKDDILANLCVLEHQMKITG